MDPSFRLLFDKVLVVALQEQRPEQDGEVASNLERHIDHYKRRIVAVSKDMADEAGEMWPDEIEPALRFYDHTSCLLWGDYDYATFFLVDDLESIVQISKDCDAFAQEFLFGSPYALEGEKKCLESISALFLRERKGNGPTAQSHPLIAITRVKLGDHLIAVSVELRRAVVRAVYQLACDKGLVPIVLRCWAWPELVVILLGEDPKNLVDVIQEIEEIDTRCLCKIEESTRFGLGRGERGLRKSLAAALCHDVPFFMLRLWVGRKRNPEEAEFLRRPEENEFTRKSRELLLESIMRRHPIVATRTQLGILRNGWIKPPVQQLENLVEAVALAFRPHMLDGDTVERGFTPEQILSELKNRREKLDFPPDRDPSVPVFRAQVTIQTKPGHSRFIRTFAHAVRESLGERARLLAGNVGQTNSIVLSLPVASSREGFFTLLCVSHCFRICEISRLHLLMITTHLEWPIGKPKREDFVAMHEAREQFVADAGFGLFRKPTPVEASEFARQQFRRLRIGRVESLNIRAWLNAISRVTTRPEMLGAMIEVYRSAQLVLRELMTYEGDDGDYGIASKIASEVLKMGPHFQRAYQQRLQFSPVLSGAPPINGQLPYGVNQIVRMVDGVTAAVMHAAFLNDASDCENPDLPARATLVTFTPHPAVATQAILDFGLVMLNLLQALTPLSLSLLFHEMGHLLIRRYCWTKKNDYETFWRNRGAWEQVRLDAIENLRAKLPETWPASPVATEDAEGGLPPEKKRDLFFEQFHTFIEDMFTHSVMRRVGCADSDPDETWRYFSTQVLASHGMGLRIPSSLNYPKNVALDVWTGVLAHLLIQEVLHLSKNLEEALRKLRDLFIGDSWKDPFYDLGAKASPYFRGELNHLQPTEPAGQLTALGKEFENMWLPVLQLFFSELISKSPSDSFKELKNSLCGLFSLLDTIEVKLRRAENRVREQDRDTYAMLRSIVERIRHGESVVDVPWSLISSRRGHGDGAAIGGCPTEMAVLWIREILKGVTLHFLDARKVGRSISIDRDERLLYRGPSDGGEAKGVFVDFLGGLFVAGRGNRVDYLKVRLAAIESMSALANRILAGPIGLRFERSRHFLRKPMPEGTKTWLTVPGSDHRFEVSVVDQSAVSAAFELDEEQFQYIEEVKPEDVRIPCVEFSVCGEEEIRDVECKIVRIDRKRRRLAVCRVASMDFSEVRKYRSLSWLKTIPPT